MKKFKRFLVRKMDECKEQGLGGSVWVMTLKSKDPENPWTIHKLNIGKKVIAGVRIEPNLRCVEVPDLHIDEQRHPMCMSPDALEILRIVEDYAHEDNI